MVVALADLHSQVGRVGHGQVSGVGYQDRNCVDPAGQEADAQAKLRVLA